MDLGVSRRVKLTYYSTRCQPTQALSTSSNLNLRLALSLIRPLRTTLLSGRKKETKPCPSRPQGHLSGRPSVGKRSVRCECHTSHGSLSEPSGYQPANAALFVWQPTAMGLPPCFEKYQQVTFDLKVYTLHTNYIYICSSAASALHWFTLSIGRMVNGNNKCEHPAKENKRTHTNKYTRPYSPQNVATLFETKVFRSFATTCFSFRLSSYLLSRFHTL